ncbi:MAG: tetratricopeptide repeat protein [Desulfobulbaceae bacterium]|nr:tetratricopeptide repeat protein [Desulfobulbaceae bacterium]
MFWKNISDKTIYYLTALSFLLIGIFVYSNSLNVPFYFDDFNTIQDSSLRMDNFSLDTITNAVSKGKLKERPVANLSFALNYFLHGYMVQGYHIVNITIHIFNSIILYYFILLTLKLPANKDKFRNPLLIAYVTSLIWLVHPLGTQSVTYLVQRMNSLAFMFYLLSMICYVRARSQQIQFSKSNLSGPVYGNFCLTIFFGVLAIGSKEISASLPIMILIYELYFFQDFSFKPTKVKILWLGLIAASLIGLMYLYLGQNPWRIFTSTCSGREFTAYERLLTQFRVLIHYITLTVFPHPDRLIFDYNFPFSRSFLTPITTLYSFLALFVVFLTSLIIARKERILSFCIIGFFITLVIESSIICLELVYEHRTYLPSIFLILFFVTGIYRITNASRIVLGCLLIIVIPFSVWTYERNQIWQDPLVFWKDTVNKAPDKPRSLNNLGNAFYYRDNYDEAISSYKKALYTQPDFLPTLKNISIAYMAIDEYDAAEEYCRIALQYAPNFVDVHNNLAAILFKKYKIQNAEKHYLRALELSPDHALANKNFGGMLLRTGRSGEALPFLQKAAQFKKNDPELLLNLGESYLLTGKYTEALATYNRVLEIDDDSAPAHYNFALILAGTGSELEALKHYKKAVDLNPFYIPALYNYGNLLFRTGEIENAFEQYQKIIEMRPEMANAYNNLGLIMLQKKKYDDALKLFQEALQIMPDHEVARKNIELLKSE